MKPFEDRVVLITGAGRGIGKRLALGFAAAGARVGLLARSRGELELAKLEIEAGRGAALPISADVRDFERVCAAVDRMQVVLGGVHVLVCAAAIQGPIGPLVGARPKDWAETFETNVIGVMHACRAVLPGMIQQRSGKIVVISGGGAAYPRPYFSAYAASKTAVVRLVETLAEEVRDANIQVNCMAPGGTYTHMTDEILQAGARAGAKEIEAAEKIRITGGATPDQQLQLALFLASQRSNHISGKLIHVNDDWRRLEHENANPELLTLRRVQKV